MQRTRLVLAGILSASAWCALSASPDSEPRLETKITVNDEVLFTVISPDGKIAAVLKSNKIGIWSIVDAHQFQMLGFGVGQPVFCDFLDNGTRLLVALRSGKIQLHDSQTGKILWSLDNGVPPEVVRVSRDGKWLAAAGRDREVLLWDLTTGKLAHRLGLELGSAMDLAFSPDATMLAGSSNDTNIYVWDTRSGELKHVVRDLLMTTFGLAFAPDGKWLYAGNGDHAVYVIDGVTGKVAKSFAAQKYPVLAISLSPDGQRIAAVYRDANDPQGHTPMMLWSAASAQMLQKVDSPGVTANGGGFLNDGRLLYSSTSGKEMMVWSLR